VLVLVFTAFNVESHATCKKDYLKIRDDDGTLLMGKTCGNTLPATITSNTNIVYLDFKTNNKITKTGYSISWWAVSSGAGPGR